MSRRLRPKPEFALQQRVEQMWEEFDYPETDQQIPFDFNPGGGGDPTVFIACADATDQSKAMAHIIATGTDDHDALSHATGIILSDGPTTGGRIVVSEGTLNIDPGIVVVLDSIHLHGLGAFRTLIANQVDGSSSDALIAVQFAGEVSDIGFNTTSTFAGRAVESNGGRITNIWHQGGAAAGLWVEGADNAIDNIHLNGNYTDAGLVIDDGRAIVNNVASLRNSTAGGGASVRITSNAAAVSTISNLIISHSPNVGHGVVIEGPDELQISNFAISTPGDSAIVIDDNTPFNLILANGYMDGDYGISIQDSAGLVRANFSNLTIIPDLIGIDLDTMRESTISNVIIDNPGEHGVQLNDSFGNILTGIFVIEPGQDTDDTYDGIILTGNSDRNYIYGNKILAPAAGNQPRYGINISASTCNCNVVVANMLGDSSTYGSDPINDAGTDTQLRWPTDAINGDNFTECIPSSPTSP